MQPAFGATESSLLLEWKEALSIEIPALLALSSLRRAEIMALRWENIDLDRKIIKVRGAAVPDEHHKLTQKKENKNTSSTRSVPIMIDELQGLLRPAKIAGHFCRPAW